MYHHKGISIKLKRKRLFFVGFLKIPDEKIRIRSRIRSRIRIRSRFRIRVKGTDARIQIRIRIRTKMSRIPNAEVPVF
jgi:hypothetical protein